MNKISICGNEKCCASTDISGRISHGWGKLDSFGFWEFKCPETNNKHRMQDNEIYKSLGEHEFVIE